MSFHFLFFLFSLPLLVPAQELCEELRDGEPERDLKPLLDEVAAAYQKVLGIVERLD